MTLREQQLETCIKHRVDPVPCGLHEQIGLALTAVPYPIQGLRRTPEAGACGWMIWTGVDPPEQPEAFTPVHVVHLQAQLPDVLPYLALPPGWRFLIAPGYEEVWQEPDEQPDQAQP